MPTHPLASLPGGSLSASCEPVVGCGGTTPVLGCIPAGGGEGGATAHVPGTCGELVQGTYDGVYCLVSCPIDRYSTATVTLSDCPGLAAPPDAAKAVAALQRLLALAWRGDGGVTLSLSSPLPRSRGYGSSTADIGATLYAACTALGLGLCPLAAARIAVAVEPSDSSILPGLSLLDHRGASCARLVAPAPAIAVLLLDPGEEVDTLAFNAVDHGRELRRLEAVHGEAMALLLQGLRDGDAEAVGQAATLSATAHQSILFSPLLEPALVVAESLHALGVCRAHSGTILGILLDPQRADTAAALRYARRCVGTFAAVSPAELVDGGPRYSSPACADAEGRRLVAGATEAAAADRG